MERLGRHRDGRARVSTAEILTIAVVAARYVSRHYERAVQMMNGRRCWRDRIGVVRVNRRRHQRTDGMAGRPEVLGEAGATGIAVIIDRLPAPVSVRRRARPALSEGAWSHTRQVAPGKTGDVRWMARAAGPLPASSVDARSEAARILAETGAPLVVRPGAAMRPHAWWMDAIAVRADRHTMETVNRHLETMGSERLPRGANAGFERKVP
jgi:hypothetical protein